MSLPPAPVNLIIRGWPGIHANHKLVEWQTQTRSPIP